MTQGATISINAIPACAMYDDPSGTTLRRLLTDLDQRVSRERGVAPDGFIDEAEFARARQTTGFFHRRWDFAEFGRYLEATIQGQRCSDRCKAEQGLQDATGDGVGPLCAAPRAPEPPPPLPPPTARPKPRPRLSLTQDNELPEWAQSRYTPPPKASPPVAMLKKSTPDLRLGGGLTALLDEMPVRDTQGPKISASFDGQYFILDFHGCTVDPAQRKVCLHDWPLFWLRLQNRTSGANSRRQADRNGWARIRVAAKPGDGLEFWGVDSVTGGLSLNKLLYEITAAGQVRFLGDYWVPPPTVSTAEKVAAMVGHFVPQVTSVFDYAKDPVGWTEAMREASECYMTDSHGNRHRNGACDHDE